MNLTELYQSTPIGEHQNIKVLWGKIVIVYQTDGTRDVYALGDGGELHLIFSNLS